MHTLKHPGDAIVAETRSPPSFVVLTPTRIRTSTIMLRVSHGTICHRDQSSMIQSTVTTETDHVFTSVFALNECF